METMQYETDERARLSNQKRLRTLIVDDHPIFRDGLRELLMTTPDFEVCGEAEREDEAIQQVLATDPDLITVDISLASGSGLSLISRIKKHKPSAIILAISMYEDRAYAERALAAGASGYVCKHADNKELKLALQMVQRGEIYVNRSILQRMLAQKGSTASASLRMDQQLSGRELEIFNLIGRGRTTPQIAQQLGIAISTVETYRERLKTKLNLSTGAELTRHAILWMAQTT
jgi:DNA-binding NarL/FixJ family response regulator